MKTFGRTVVSALAIACVAPVAASADTQVIGSALALPYQGGVATAAGVTTVQQTQVGGNAPFPLTAPGNGTVTGWAVRTSDDDTVYVLRVLRPAGTNTYNSVGRITAPAAIPAGAVDTIFTFPGTVPIEKGDHIGLLQEGNPDEGVAQNSTGAAPTNVIANRFSPFGDGVPTAFIPDQQNELLLQATVKYCKVPSLVGQRRRAAEQAITAADCTAKVVKKPLKLKKKKKKSKKNKKIRAQNGKVISQTPAPDASAANGSIEVKIKVGELRKKKKKKNK